jgi:hypothetical protein
MILLYLCFVIEFIYVYILVLIHLCWFGHADVGPSGHEADVAWGLVDEQVEEGWPRRHHRFDDQGQAQHMQWG